MTWNELEQNNDITNKKRFDIVLFLTYSSCAAVATIVDISILYSLTELFDIWYFNAAVFGYLGGMVTNFTLNKILTFKNRSRAIFRQFGLFIAVALIGLGINQLVIYGLVEYAGMWYLLAKFIAIAVVVTWSFFGHKNLTFKIYE